MTYSRFRELLGPFQPHLNRYMAGVVLRQALLVLGGYSLVWALRACLAYTGVPAWVFVAGFILFDAGFVGFDNALNYFFAERVSYPLFGHLRATALGKVFQMPMEWHHRKSSGTLVGEVNNAVGKVVQTAEGVSRELLPALIQTAFSLVPLLLFSPATTPAILGALAVFLWLTVVENRRRQPFKKSRYDNYARDFGVFAESVESVQPLVQFGQTGRMLRRYRRVQDRIVQDGLEEARIANRFGWRRNLILSIAKRACQGMWIWQYRQGSVDPALIMYLNMLTEQLLTSFWGYAALIERIYDGVEPTKVLVKLLDEKPAITDDPSAMPVRIPERVGIRMHEVEFGYARGRRVLHKLNLSIPEGRIVGVVGRSGCGKTTLHNLMSRMYEVQQGRIVISGEDIRRWPLEQLRGLFSYVSQDGGIFFAGTSMLNTLRFTRPEASFREVVEVAKAVCIHDDIVKMPKKYKTLIGQGGVTLSKGQQQRVALAQALLALGNDRKVLILDEFTSALDSETEERIMENIFPHLNGRTIIIIAHRLSTIRKVADRIIVLDEGGILEQGTHAELIRHNGWYAEMARLQATEPSPAHEEEAHLVYR